MSTATTTSTTYSGDSVSTFSSVDAGVFVFDDPFPPTETPRGPMVTVPGRQQPLDQWQMFCHLCQMGFSMDDAMTQSQSIVDDRIRNSLAAAQRAAMESQQSFTTRMDTRAAFQDEHDQLQELRELMEMGLSVEEAIAYQDEMNQQRTFLALMESRRASMESYRASMESHRDLMARMAASAGQVILPSTPYRPRTAPTTFPLNPTPNLHSETSPPVNQLDPIEEDLGPAMTPLPPPGPDGL